MKNLKKLGITAGLVLGLAFATPAFAATNYTVQSGDTVANIALANGVSQSSLEEINSIVDIYNLPVGAVLVIPSVKQGKVIDKAYSLLGTTPYVFGGTTPYTGMDCSGYAQWVYRQAVGISLPRTASDMWSRKQVGTKVTATQANLQPGDLVFFAHTDPDRPDLLITHMGIYVGDGNFIEESSTYNNVVVKPLFDGGFYTQHLYGAKRIVN
jgi:cell wall-associated NlpC family hydrolase